MLHKVEKASEWRDNLSSAGDWHRRLRWGAHALLLFSLVLHPAQAHEPRRKLSGYGFGLSTSTLKSMFGFVCPAGKVVSLPYPGVIPTTALASFPRSGSSFTRSLVERATGYQSSSLYCDVRLFKFKAECLGLDSPFLVKTHFPISGDINPEVPHWKHYDRAIRVIRNPFDSIWSAYHFSLTANHSARADNVKNLTMENKAFLQSAVSSWLTHISYWSREAQIPVHVVRYEDLRDRAAPTLERLLRFMLAPHELPTRKSLECAVSDDPQKDPYWSRKSPSFSSYMRYDLEARSWILEAVKEEWCKHDYNAIFVQSMNLPAPADCSNITSVLPQ